MFPVKKIRIKISNPQLIGTEIFSTTINGNKGTYKINKSRNRIYIKLIQKNYSEFILMWFESKIDISKKEESYVLEINWAPMYKIIFSIFCVALMLHLIFSFLMFEWIRFFFTGFFLFILYNQLKQVETATETFSDYLKEDQQKLFS